MHQTLETRLEGLLGTEHWPPWIAQPGRYAFLRMLNAAFEDSLRIRRLYSKEEVLAEYG